MPLPETFNPLATHPFTSYTSSVPPMMSSPPSSLPAPMPLRPLQPAKPVQKPGIFVPFRQGASSPDLNDILRKKPTSKQPLSSNTTPKSSP
ncbi:hypothetical protein V5O48_001411 [Marasmius crinis-equi]|uniref:Uncharacterized protein n=1 Tax=Marasmius crinis-equi TaxID=585013 RepID=A0ABR3FYH9_9AGAR